jgi:hypothetical protein
MAAAGMAMFCAMGSASAGVIQSPTSGTINSGGPGNGTLTETINQTGLLSGFTSGVTDFATYMATNPKHSLIYSGNEWFSNSGTTSASVTYDLGASYSIDKLALWNEESSGIGLLNLYSSTDGVNFFALSLGLTPTDNPLADYPADVFSFATTNARYVRFDMSRCPQQNPGNYVACAIGEVAFDVTTEAPEPGSLALLAIALAGLGTMKRKQRA